MAVLKLHFLVVKTNLRVSRGTAEVLKVRVGVRKDKEVRAKPSSGIVHSQHRATQYNMLPINTGFFANLDNQCRVASVRCVSDSLSSGTET